MLLELTPLAKALASLERALQRSREAPEDDVVRDGVIQRFEYSYELAWRMLKRRLQADAPTPAEIDRLGFKDLIRAGASRGYIADPTAWFGYREMRNITSHTYDEQKAREVYRAALAFHADARALLESLASSGAAD